VGVGLIPVSLVRWVLDGFLYASDRARLASVSLIVTAAAQLVGVAATGAIGRLDSATVLMIVIGSTLLGSVPSAVGVWRLDEEDRTEDESTPISVPRLFRVGLTVHAGTIATWVAQRVDVFIVSALVVKRQLGLYSLAITLSEFVLLSTEAIALAALGRQRALDRQRSFEYSALVAKRAAVIAAVQVGLLILFGWPLIRLAYGATWIGAYPVLAVMSVGMIALAYVRPFGAAFVRAERFAEVALLLLAAGAINVVGTLLAVPLLGIVGGGIVSTLAYFTTATLFVWRVRRSLGVSPWPDTAQEEPLLPQLVLARLARGRRSVGEETPGL
jgi:O-antigen/teichoic acid export membrane protein